jgi:hypothetical protein
MRSYPLLLGTGLILLAATATSAAEDFRCTQAELSEGCQGLAREQLLRRENRWRQIQATQEVTVGGYPEIILRPAKVEAAFQSFHKRSANIGDGKEKLSKVLTTEEAAKKKEGLWDGLVGTAKAGVAWVKETASSKAKGPELGVLTVEEEGAGLALVSPGDMMIRIRAQVKTEAIMDQTGYGKILPLQGLHPFQTWLLTERVAPSADLALHEVLAKLGDLFATTPLSKPADGLAHVFVQKETGEMLRGYASYRYHRAYPDLDTKVVESTLRKLKGFFSDEDGMDSSELFFQSLFDMLLSCRKENERRDARSRDGRVVDLLFAVFVDYQVATLGLADRFEVKGQQDLDKYEKSPGRRVLRALTLDPVLSGAKLRTSRNQDEAWTSPFGELSAAEHMRRLRRFSDRLQKARKQLAEALSKVVYAKKMEAAQGKEAQRHVVGFGGPLPVRFDEAALGRLVEEVGRLTFGADRSQPDADSIVGILSSPEFQAERRYLLAQGPSKDPGVRQAYLRLFGDAASSKPQGEVARVEIPLKNSILPFLRRRRVSEGRESPSSAEDVVRSRERLADLERRIHEIDRELWELSGRNPSDPRIQELQQERDRLLGEYERREQDHAPSSPREQVDRFRRVRRWLQEGRVPDGEGGTRPLNPEERRALEREAEGLGRQLDPSPGEARRRAEDLDERLRRNEDLRGRQITDPRVRDEIREERDRMRAVARGERVPPPGLGSSDRDIYPTDRRDPFQGGERDRDQSWRDWKPSVSREPPRRLPNGNPQPTDPNTGRRIDTESGRQIMPGGGLGDRPTGQPVNPVTNRPVDPRTGEDLPVDSKTGNPVNRDGRQIDTRTGQVGPKAEGPLVDGKTGNPVTPGIGTKNGKGFGATNAPKAPDNSKKSTSAPGKSVSPASSNSPRSAGTSGVGVARNGKDAFGATRGTTNGKAATEEPAKKPAKEKPKAPDPKELDAWANQQLAAWMAAKGGNPYGLPTGAPVVEIQSMLQAEANKKAPAGLSYNRYGQLEGTTKTGTIRTNGRPDGDIWPPDAKAAVAKILTERIEAQRKTFRAEADRKFAVPVARNSGGPSSTAQGR